MDLKTGIGIVAFVFMLLSIVASGAGDFDVARELMSLGIFFMLAAIYELMYEQNEKE